MLTILSISLISTTTVSAQTIKKVSQNQFIIDSLGVKDYALQITKSKYLDSLVNSYKVSNMFKDSKIFILNHKIEKLEGKEKNYIDIIKKHEDKDILENKLAKEKVMIIKRQRNTAYVVTATTLILATLLLVN